MKPEESALYVLSTTRARAKMHEFRVAPIDFNRLPRDPAILFSLAIGILGDISAAIIDQQGDESIAPYVLPRPPSWDDYDLLQSIRFASIFFDEYSNAKLGAEPISELSLLCAAAYYIAGNIGSSKVVIHRIDPPDIEIAGGLARLLYFVLKSDLDADEIRHNVWRALSNFYHLRVQRDSVLVACDKMHFRRHRYSSPRELFYSDVVFAVCKLKLRNAARTILPIASGLTLDKWRETLEKPRFPKELWPAQQLIADADVLKGFSAVIQMPTSAGKTRATELIIRSAFLSERAKLAVIVAPYRSLCHDIRGDFSSAFFGENIRMSEASDSYQFDLDFNELSARNSILIVTPEKLLYMLQHKPAIAEQIDLVIYDEGHQFDGMVRGPTYELLLTSLRMALADETQIVLISAVIGNADAIAEWLIGSKDTVVNGGDLLPTTKSIAFSSWRDRRGRLEYVQLENPEICEFFVPRVIEDVQLQPKPKETVERRFPKREDGGDIGLFLGLHVVCNGSVAIFCGKKDSVAKICKRAIDIFDRGITIGRPIESSNESEVMKIKSLLVSELGQRAVATRAAELGIFAHHADTPHGIRLAIEYAMKKDLAKFVVCTSTLAQGVNFPLKYLIVTSTRQGQENMRVREFQNLIGRAGRAGMHTEGSVIFSTPSIYDQRSQDSGIQNWSHAVELLNPDKSEPAHSAILELFDDYRQRRPRVVQPIRQEWLDLAFADAARIEEVVQSARIIERTIEEQDFRKFIKARAHVVQNIATFIVANLSFEDDQDPVALAAELAENTLAYHLANEEKQARLIDLFRLVGNSIINHTSYDQRNQIRKSPLPPVTVLQIQTWLTENLQNLQQAENEDRLFAEIAYFALRKSNAREIATINRPRAINGALRKWVNGLSYAEIFEFLSKVGVRFGRRNLTVEHTVALCEHGFRYDVAMVVASIADLIELLGDNQLSEAVALLQRKIKIGLTDTASIAFYEAGFADRYVAAMLGEQWKDVTDSIGVRYACSQRDEMYAALEDIPSYFVSIAAELGGWD